MTIEPARKQDSRELLYLLQLASPGLPVGAYSYSEGLETLVDAGVINNPQSLAHWLKQELSYGGIRLEAAIMVRGYRSIQSSDLKALSYWNAWLSAARETEELRLQSWQMGRSLLKLLLELQPEVRSLADTVDNTCNYAIAFAIAATHWEVDLSSALLAYLQSWANNLIGAGVKLIPLGQTAGQKLLLNLQIDILNSAQKILVLEDDDLNSCGWGLSLASMNHETLYTRLFRS